MARSEFQRAALDKPDNADYLHNLASAMKKQGDSVAAEQTYRQAINVDPGHQPSQHSLIQLMFEQGRKQEAIEVAQTWVDTEPYLAEPHLEMAWIQRELGNVTLAEESLQKALESDPQNSVALAHLGQLYQQTGQPDRAAAMYQRSLAYKWYQPEVQSRLATVRPKHRGARHTRRTVAYSPQPTLAPVAGSRRQARRIARTYPLPNYGTPAGLPTSQISAGPTPQLAQPIIPNADPAHTAPQISAVPGVIEPF